MAEIKDAFFSLPRNKTCGPDGYTAELFTACWNIIQVRKVIEAVEPSTMLVLIPKIPTTDFRPISCLNTMYKVIAPLLATRFRDILTEVISTSQSAFMPGRLLARSKCALCHRDHSGIQP